MTYIHNNTENTAANPAADSRQYYTDSVHETTTEMNTQTPKPDIFLLETDQKLNNILKVLFEPTGRNVITLSSTSNVSGVFALRPTERRIIVIDIHSPSFAGLKLMDKIVMCNPHVHIIAAYDHIDIDYVAPRLVPQVVTMIKKPFNFTEIVNAIYSIINEESQ